MDHGTAVKNVVLVHGGFVDGSGWQRVYGLLKQDGYKVAIVQNPTLSLEADAAATRQVLQAQDGPASWSATRTVGPHHRGGHRPERRGSGVRRRIRAR